MAIAFDDATSSQVDASNTLTWSHTVAAGSNKILIAAVAAEDNADATHNKVSSVTFNGESFTKIRNDETTASNNDNCELWYLLNPTSTAANIVVTWAGSVEGGIGMVMGFTGVDQTAPDASNGGSAVAPSSVDPSVVSIVDNSLIVSVCVGISSGVSITVDTGTQAENVTNTGQLRAACAYTLDGGTAGTELHGYTFGSVNDCAYTIAALAPATTTAVKDLIMSGFIPFAR